MLYILPFFLAGIVILVVGIVFLCQDSDWAVLLVVLAVPIVMIAGLVDAYRSDVSKYIDIQPQDAESMSAVLVPLDTEKSNKSYFTTDDDKITFWIEDKGSKEMKCQTASIDNVVVKYCGTKETPHVETTPSKCVLTSKPNFWTSATVDWELLHKYNVGDVISDTKVNMTKSVKITYILYVPEDSSMNAVNSVSK